MKRFIAGASLILIASLAACSPGEQDAQDTQNAATAPAAAPDAVEAVEITVPAGEYVADANHSSMTVRMQHLGLGYYTMRFRTYDATVTFDPENIAASKVVATVRPSDILVGFPGDYVADHPGTQFTSWEDDLANNELFLNARQHPEIRFVSTSVEPSGGRTAKVTGDLTLLGVTRPMTLDVTFAGQTDSHAFANVPAVGFSATGTFSRSEFGLGSHLPAEVVGDEITVTIDGDFIQATPA